MNRIAIYLNKIIDGAVYSAPSILEHYSTDRSMLKISPRVVALPENTMDLRRLVRFSHQLSQKKISLPITVRGAGHSKTGAGIGSGLVILTERMANIQEIDVRQRLVRVQCGVRLGELKKALSLLGLDIPVMGNPFETIGGLIANCASASNNTEPSTIADFIDRAEVVLNDGTLLEVRNLSHRYLCRILDQADREGCLYHNLDDLIEKEQESIELLPENKKNRFGYSGLRNVKTKHSFSLLPLICGSEGTLGIISEVILRVEPVFDQPNHVAIHCKTATNYVSIVEELKKLRFTDIVMYDMAIFAESEKTGKGCEFFRKTNGEGYLIVANVKDDSHRERRRKLAKMYRNLPNTTRIIEESDENASIFAGLDRALSVHINDDSANNYHIPLIDGAYIPPEKQAKYLDDVKKLSESMKLPMPVYGSADFDTFSLYPSFNPSTVAGRKKLVQFIGAYLKIITECYGYPCGEAPEGRFLAIFAQKFETQRTLDLYKKVKEIFDPDGILNPGIKQNVDTRNTLKHFRTDYNREIREKE